MDIVTDYRLLADALDFYEDLGYTRVELPWAVPVWAVRATAPRGVFPQLGSSDECLVGSAEQAFLYCDVMRKLPAGRYCAITPCIRIGDNKRPYHEQCFMKVELYRNDDVDRYAVDEMILEVSEFARQQLRNEKFALERLDTPEMDIRYLSRMISQTHTADLNLNGIEIGSYGLRTYGAVSWAYGTGIAEPRFSQARKHPYDFDIEKALEALA